MRFWRSVACAVLLLVVGVSLGGELAGSGGICEAVSRGGGCGSVAAALAGH